MKCLKNNIYLVFFVSILIVAGRTLPQSVNTNEHLTIRRLAESFERAGQFQNAADYYMRAALANPKDIAAYLGAKRTLDRIQDYDRFEELILTLEQKRRDIRYRVDLAWITYKRGDESGARSKWERILTENSKNQGAYALIGQIYSDNQQYEDAIQIYRSARKTLKNDTIFMFELANLYKIVNEQEKLVREYLNYLRIYPRQATLLSAELQQFSQTQQDLGPLLKSLKKALKSPDDLDWAIHLFLADIYNAMDDYENALYHYIELEAALQNVKTAQIVRSYQKGQYLYEFANQALRSDAMEYSERAFLAIISHYSDSRYLAKSKLGLAKVYTKNQNYEKALDALQLFIESNKRSNDTRYALLQIAEISFSQLFDIERAEKAYKRALREYPNPRFQIDTMFKLAECALARDDLVAAEKCLKDALKKSANEQDLKGACLLHLAYFEFYRMRPRQSLDYLNDFETIRTAQPDILENDALELMILLQENSHDSTGLAVLGQSRLWMKQKKYDEVRHILETFLMENTNPLLRSELRLQLADVYRKTNNFEPAVSTLDSIYTDQESLHRDEALLASAEIYEKNIADYALAQQQYEKLLEEFPGSIHLEYARERIRKLEQKK